MYFYKVRFTNLIDDAILLRDQTERMKELLKHSYDVVDLNEIAIYSEESLSMDTIMEVILSTPDILNEINKLDHSRLQMNLIECVFDQRMNTIDVYKKKFSDPKVTDCLISFSKEQIVDRVEDLSIFQLLTKYASKLCSPREILTYIFSKYFLI